MKIGIIVAMQKELALLLPLVANAKENEIDGFKVTEGKLGAHDVVVMQCGIGKVNAALSTYSMIKNEHPDLVINTGVCGGADSSTNICDILIADSVAYHDVWCGPGTEYGAANGYPVRMQPDTNMLNRAREILTDKNVHIGLLCSGDKFIASEEEVKEIKNHFPDALGVDMESAPIAQTCMSQNVPFMILRAISDTPGSGENIAQYEDFWTKAPESTFNTLLKLLSESD